ncbi:uncharacterized protein LOC135093561 [Scylla paramamosain]|uniref:uncharacterized protein LOC135093561 n=1 Tax=Scylla paramamosain TaxID=85552 RepID=UPI0030833927
MENVKFCEASPYQVQEAWQIGLLTGLGVYGVLYGLGLILTNVHVLMPISYCCHAHLARLVPAFTLVGAVAFLADAHKERHGLVTCDPWSGLQWVTFLVNLCFMVRLGINFCVTYQPQLMATVVDVWLFTQACFALNKGLNLYAFTFLTLIRFFHPECLMAWSRLNILVRTGFGVVLATLVVAGALQVAEEHDTLYGTHSTAQGTLQPIRSFWSYEYWTVVTVSTVGYGEITPSTSAGKVVATIAVVAGVVWYVAVAGRMSVAMKEYFREARYPPPESSRPRIIVLSESDPKNLTRLLRAVSRDNGSDVEVIVLTSAELTPCYLQLTGLLPIKVVSCTDLQQDLTNLLPGTDNKRYSNARQHDAVVLFSDHEAENPETEDARMLQLLVQARACVPGRRFIVQVLLSCSRRAVQQTPCWSARDVVVCMEELTVDLLAQAVVCSAAGPVMSSLLKAPTACSKEQDQRPMHLRLHQPSNSTSEAEDFVKAALELYRKRGDLLLGWLLPETQDFDLLPDELPFGVQWVVISADDESTQIPLPTILSDMSGNCCGHPEEVDVVVHGAEPGRIALEDALQEFTNVNLFSEVDWRSASTMVMTTAGMAPSYTIEAHCQRIMVKQPVKNASETKRIRFVTDVHPGQGQRAWDERTTCDVVSKSVVVWATAAVILDHTLYRIWRRLAASSAAVSVKVLLDCTYWEAFQELLSDRLLPLAVKSDDGDDCCITNPPAMLRLAPGSLLLCFQISPAVEVPLSSITLSQGTRHS